MTAVARVSSKGARRWASGHPWIYRSDLAERPDAPPGAVRVESSRREPLGWALWSPRSEIALRFIERDPEARINRDWWQARIGQSIHRRAGLESRASAFRLVHGEADGCPSLVCDRYGEWLVVQLLSAGIEAFRPDIVAALKELTGARGILGRNDPPVRSKEGLPRLVELLDGDVPKEIEVREGSVRYIAAPWDGQKTGAFLDQRENRELVGSVARGHALDCFSYHGSFALHIARSTLTVTAVDTSATALARAAENARLNGLSNVATVEADVFDFLRECEAADRRFSTIVLDPPAFAKTKPSLPGALRGYKEINLRAMRLLEPGGVLFTASCSFHLSRESFHAMLMTAAADSGRRLSLRTMTGQPSDHPEVLTIPETGYLKGALIEAQE